MLDDFSCPSQRRLKPVLAFPFAIVASIQPEGLCCKKKTDLLKWVEKRTRGFIMAELHPFKWRHFQSDIILLCVRWYLRYALSYRDLEEMMLERGLHVDHTTIYRWGKSLRP